MQMCTTAFVVLTRIKSVEQSEPTLDLAVASGLVLEIDNNLLYDYNGN